MADLRGSAGHRIDAICSQLITSRQHTPALSVGQQVQPAAASLCDSVVVKQEVVDTVDSSEQSHHHHHHHDYHHLAQRHHTTAAAAAAAADKDKTTHSALAALTDW